MATLYVSKTGDDSNDGSTPALAKLTIGAALTAAANDYTIDIGVGSYSEEVTCGSLTGITIKGATGRPEDVVITSNGASTPTMKLHTDCSIQDLTIKYLPGPLPGVNYATIHGAVGSANGSNTTFHATNCYIYSTRKAVHNAVPSCVLNRIRFIWAGTSPDCLTTGSVGYPLNTYVYPYAYNASAGQTGPTCISCLFQDWARGTTYRGGGPYINCTIVRTRTSEGTSTYDLFANNGNITNVIAFANSSSIEAGYNGGSANRCGVNNATTGHVGLANDGTHAAYNCISHGHTGWTQGDFASATWGALSTNVDPYGTSEVEAAGGPAALYVDHNTKDDGGLWNVRIRSGSLAYRSGNNAEALKPTYDLDGKPFHPTNPSRGCYEYCFGHTASGVPVRKQSGSLGVGSTHIKTIMGVAT